MQFNRQSLNFRPLRWRLAQRIGAVANDRAAPAQHRQRQRQEFEVDQFPAPAEGGALSTPHFNASEHVTSATGANVPGVNHVRHSVVSSWSADRSWDLEHDRLRLTGFADQGALPHWR